MIAGKNDKRNLVFPFYLKPEEDETASENGVNAQNGAHGLPDL